ncbi:MAG: hypothetical protein JSS35_16245 [Proteobacteria bacterium]|nr:hypothetical protein [Pseudomonadota bacterium]
MTGQPETHEDPKGGERPRAPRPPQQGADVNKAKLGRETPGRGLDTGVDLGQIQPGASGDASPLDD